MVTIKCCKCGYEQTEEIYTIGDEWSLSETTCEACGTDLAFNDKGQTLFLSAREPVSITVDIICYKSSGEILLIKRANAPEIGKWALPGGFVNPNETCERAAARELLEETGIDIHPYVLELVGVFSRPDRDPRGRVISVLYAVEVASDVNIVAGDDAKDARFISIGSDLYAIDLAFDHTEMYLSWYISR